MNKKISKPLKVILKLTIFSICMILLLIILITIFTKQKEKISNNPSPTIKVFFCPRQDCETALINVIKNSKKYVHCAFFDLDLTNLTHELYVKSKIIDVKLVIDSDNKKDWIIGKNIVYQTKSPYMHNKFCIIDGKILTTGSMNPTFNDANKNNNNLVIIKSDDIAKNYEIEFKELYGGIFGKGTPTSNPIIKSNDNNTIIKTYFCPEDSCSYRIKEELLKSNNSIYFMIFSFTDRSIANMLILKNIEGLNIKGILDKTQNSALNSNSVYNYLVSNNISVKHDKNSNFLHHKVFIIDNTTVITGSFNPSKNADNYNDENVIIITDPKIAKLYQDEFDLIY